MAAQEYYNGVNSFNTAQQHHAGPVSTANYPVEPPLQYQPYVQQDQLETPPLNHNRPAFLLDHKPIYPAPVGYQQPLPEHIGPQQYNLQPQQQYPAHHQPHAPYPQQPPLPHAPYSNPGKQYTSQPQPYSSYPRQQYPHQPPYERPSPQQVHFEDDPYDASSEDEYERERERYLHLRPSRSYSEPPHHHHHRHHRHQSPSPYSSRSRSRSHSRERPRNRNIEIARGSKKLHHSSTGTFLGAFGGGALGDAIFPGLGTLGGALLGGYGGHEVGKGKSRDKRGRMERGGSERPRESGRRDHLFGDTYQEEYEEGRRRRGEI